MQIQDVARLAAKKDMSGLGTALADSNAAVQKEAAIELTKMGNDKAVDVLSATLRGSNTSAMTLAAMALRGIADSRITPNATARTGAINALGATLRLTDATAQSCAAVALADIGSAPAIDVLRNAISDADANCRKAAAMALARIKTPEAQRVLVSGFRGMDPAQRAELALVLQGSDPNLKKQLLAVMHEGEKRGSGDGESKKPWWRIW